MISLLQRVSRASVKVNGESIASIGAGLVVLVGVEHNDSDTVAQRMAQRLVNYRIFGDGDGKMNLSAQDIGAEILLIPQFTLAADTTQGNRPGFSTAAEPGAAKQVFEKLSTAVRAHNVPMATGLFGADMQVALINDGPVTFHLRVAGS